MKLYETDYKDIKAIACETKKLKAIFLPDYGAKLTSLVSLENGREFLEQAKGKEYKKPCYGGSYVDAECSAFDDMFPTIDAFICTEEPWKGVEYPDHGEVYALRWKYEILKDGLHMWTYSVRFGYRMDKWVTEEDGTLRIRYQVENLTDFEFNYIYAPHCMLAGEEGMVLELPYEGQEEITTIFSMSGRLGKYGTRASWPVYNGENLAEMPAFSQDNLKYFFDRPIPEGKCVCRYPDGTQLVFRFDKEAMPYFAVWMNPGGFKDMCNLALEPCSGAFDRPDIAKLHRKNSVLKGEETKEWTLSFSVIEGEKY